MDRSSFTHSSSIFYFGYTTIQGKTLQAFFPQSSLHYLGHVISKDAVATDPSKVTTVKTWPTPRTVRDVHSFLGMAGYYRKFVHNFGIISCPLINLLKKGQWFVWRDEHEHVQALKTALVTTLVLAQPDFTRPFEIETDASKKGIVQFSNNLGIL